MEVTLPITCVKLLTDVNIAMPISHVHVIYKLVQVYVTIILCTSHSYVKIPNHAQNIRNSYYFLNYYTIQFKVVCSVYKNSSSPS